MPDSPWAAEPDPDTVLGKVMSVLNAFTVEDHGVGFAELQRRTGLPKATLHRVLGDLGSTRLLDRIDGAYHLGGHLFELGMRASVERGLIEVATPFLEDLYERTHELVHLGLLESHEVVYVAKMGGHRQVRSPSRLGGRMPLHATRRRRARARGRQRHRSGDPFPSAAARGVGARCRGRHRGDPGAARCAPGARMKEFRSPEPEAGPARSRPAS